MTLELTEAALWCARLTAVSVALQTLELWQIRAVCADDGVWSWPILKDEQRALPAPLRWLFAALLPYRSYLLLLLSRLGLALALGLGALWAAPLLLLSQLAIGARFRGTFNGGSDYMTVVVLLGLSLTAAGPAHPTLVKAGLAYVCVQLVLSYFIAGVVKLAQPAWRSGEALQTLLVSSRYGTPPWLGRLAGRKWWAKLSSVALLLFECGSPLALAGHRVALPWLACAVVFQLGNTLAFGLNRFLFAWAAAYPALLYFSARLA